MTAVVDRDLQAVALFECLSWIRAMNGTYAFDPALVVASAMMTACQSGIPEARAYVLQAAREGCPEAWAVAADKVHALRQREGFVSS